jgi:hypothetical protein
VNSAKQLLTSFNQALQKPCSRVRCIGLQDIRHLPCICTRGGDAALRNLSTKREIKRPTRIDTTTTLRLISGLDKVATKRHVHGHRYDAICAAGIRKDIHSVIAPITPRQSLNVVNDRALVCFWCQPRGPPGLDWLLAALASHTTVRGTLCGIVPTRRDDHYSSMTTYDVAGIDARRR